MYESLTKYTPSIGKADDYGEWIIDRKHVGTMEVSQQMPFVTYGKLAISVEDVMYNYVDTHDEMQLACYNDILGEMGYPGAPSP